MGQELLSEFFHIEIKEVNAKTDKIWDTSDTKTSNPIAFWQVTPSPGFFTLGHLATDFYDIDPERGKNAPVTITLRPKEGYEYLLKEPIGFEEIWTDRGSGSSTDGFIWRMKCPEGYIALGDIVTNSKEAQIGSVRCIKQIAQTKSGETVSLVTNASYMNFADAGETSPKAFWNDRGTGANTDAAVWFMKVSGRPAERNQVSLVAGTFKTSRYHTIFPNVEPYALSLRFPENDVMEKVAMQNKKIKLTSPRLPTKEEMKASETTNTYYIPCFAIQDDKYKNQLQQFQASPTYKVQRVTKYEAIDSYEPINTETKEFSVTIGKSTESNYNNEAGISLGLSVEVGGKAGVPLVAEGEVKVTASVEASYSHSWGGATSEYEEKSFMYPQTVTGGCFGALFQAKNTYTIYRTDGTIVGAPVSVNVNEFYTDEWRPEGILPEAKDGAAKTTSPNTITFTIDAPAGKTIIFEGRLEIRDGQLMSFPNVTTIPNILADKKISINDATPPMVLVDNFTPSYTKEVWIKNLSNNDKQNIISGAGDAQHAFAMYSRKVSAGHNGKWSYVQCPEPMSENWEHYAVTYDAKTQEMKLYRNSKLVSQSQSVPPYTGKNFAQVGKYDTAYKFTGDMAEIRIWNHVRTAEEIAAYMNVSIPKESTGLIAKYPAN